MVGIWPSCTDRSICLRRTGGVGRFYASLCLSLFQPINRCFSPVNSPNNSLTGTISGLFTAHFYRLANYIKSSSNHILFCCLDIQTRFKQIPNQILIFSVPKAQAPYIHITKKQAALAQRTPSVLAPWGQTKSRHVGDKHPGISWTEPPCSRLHRRHRFGGSIRGYFASNLAVVLNSIERVYGL